MIEEFWDKLLPEDRNNALSRNPFPGANLITVIVFDCHPRVRANAVKLLTILLENFPLLYKFANNSNTVL